MGTISGALGAGRMLVRYSVLTCIEFVLQAFVLKITRLPPRWWSETAVSLTGGIA